MSENQPNPQAMPAELLQVIAAQQVDARARSEHGLDGPRMWASQIGLSDDKENGVAVLVFRDGIRLEVNVEGATQLPPQDIFRPVASVVLPRNTVKAFLKGALEHMEAQDAEAG